MVYTIQYNTTMLHFALLWYAIDLQNYTVLFSNYYPMVLYAMLYNT